MSNEIAAKLEELSKEVTDLRNELVGLRELSPKQREALRQQVETIIYPWLKFAGIPSIIGLVLGVGWIFLFLPGVLVSTAAARIDNRVQEQVITARTQLGTVIEQVDLILNKVQRETAGAINEIARQKNAIEREVVRFIESETNRLRGPAGPEGLPGLSPSHQWQDTALRIQNPDGTWGRLVNVQGPRGESGPMGVQGRAGNRGPVGPSGPPGSLPVGSIVAWHSSLPETPTLFVEWMECNGQVVADAESPYLGQRLPNLNGEGRFLRGGTASGTMENDTIQRHQHNAYVNSFWTNEPGSLRFQPVTEGGRDFTSKKHTADGAHVEFVGDETRPVNMSVVWIIRVK